MEEILHQLRLVVYPIIYRVLYIPGGADFFPSTVFQVLCLHFGYLKLLVTRAMFPVRNPAVSKIFHGICGSRTAGRIGSARASVFPNMAAFPTAQKHSKAWW